MYWQQVDFRILYCCLVSPIHFDDVPRIAVRDVSGQPAIDAQWHKQKGGAAFLRVNGFQRIQRQMVVMRMADQYRIDMRQLRNSQSWALNAFRSRKWNRRGMVFKYGVRQDIQSGARLQKKAGMANPCERRLVGIGMNELQIRLNRLQRSQRRRCSAVRRPVSNARNPRVDESGFGSLVCRIGRIIIDEPILPNGAFWTNRNKGCEWRNSR